jgi:hypothetical protein
LLVLNFQLNLSEFVVQKTKAQFQSSYQEQLDEAIHSRLKEQNLPSHKSQLLSNLDIRKPETIPSQNVYLRILNSYTKEITPSIYEGMSLVTDLSPQEIESIIEYSNLSSLQSSTQDISQLQSSYQNLLQLYNQEKTFFTNISKIKQKALVYEIFTDNNSQNSGFDLIIDLNLIEEKLFSQSSPSSIQYPERSNYWKTYSSSPFTSRLSPVNFASFSTSTPQPSSSNPTEVNPNTNPNQTPSDETISLDPTPVYQFPKLQYGAVCQLDAKLEQEIDIFNDSLPSSPPSNTPTSNPTSDNQDQSQPSQPSVTAENTPATTPASYQSNPFQINFTDPAQSCPADQIFCFTREIKYNQIDLDYPESENCVSCIINRLNQSLQMLLDNGVLPQKITGNFGEPALCKKASIGKVGLNLNIFSKPILSEVPSPDYIQNLDPYQAQSLSQTQNATSNSNFSITKDSQVNRNLDLISQSNTQQFISQFDKNLSTSFSANSQVSQVISSQNIHFSKISNQINTLNLYLESFNTSLDQLNLNFTELINLPECSEL